MTYDPERLQFHVPPGLPAQVAGWDDTTHQRELAMIGPLGTGKTLYLAVKAALLSLANYPCEGALVVPDYPTFDRIHRREWPQILQQLGVPIRVMGAQNPVIRYPWGSRLLVYSAAKWETIVGTNLAYACGDEPAIWPKRAYERITDRIRHPQARCLQLALAGTPEGLPSWFADLFNISEVIDEPSGWSRRTIRATCWHPDMAHYPARLKQTYSGDPALLKTYAWGEFVAMGGGLAYHAFSRTAHVKPVEFDKNCPLELACDFNIDAMRWLVCQRTPTELRVIDEIAPGRHCPVPDAAAEFVRRWGGMARRVTVYGDAAGKARSSHTGTTCYDEMAQVVKPAFQQGMSLQVPKANPSVRDRVNTTNYHLAGSGGLSVVISPSCRELISDLERVAWKEGTADLDKTSDVMRTHASDAFGYWLWHTSPLHRPAKATVHRPEFGSPMPTEVRF